MLAGGAALTQPSLRNIFEEPVQSDNQLFMMSPGEDYVFLYRIFNGTEGISVDYVPVTDSTTGNNIRPYHGMIRLEAGSTLLNSKVKNRVIYLLARQGRSRDLSLYSINPD